jgi:hypothetical protein
VIIAVVAVVLAGAGVVAAVAHDEGRPAASVRGVSVPTTTTAPEPATTTTSTTAAPDAATTTAPATTVGRTTTTRRTTTTTIRPPTPTTAPAPTGTTNPPATAVLCTPDQIDINVVPTSKRVTAGQPVALQTTIRNRSSEPCFYRGYTVTMTFLDPKGSVIIAPAEHADDVQFRQFSPGQALSTSATWDPSRCASPPCAPPAPGIYSVSAEWSFSGGRYGATQQFEVTAP